MVARSPVAVLDRRHECAARTGRITVGISRSGALRLGVRTMGAYRRDVAFARLQDRSKLHGLEFTHRLRVPVAPGKRVEGILDRFQNPRTAALEPLQELAQGGIGARSTRLGP